MRCGELLQAALGRALLGVGRREAPDITVGGGLCGSPLGLSVRVLPILGSWGRGEEVGGLSQVGNGGSPFLDW